MNLNRKIILLTLLSITPLFSQQDKRISDTIKNNELDEVIVTATRTARQLSSLPLPVQIISAAQIEHSGTLRLGDILNEQTGLVVNPDFGGGLGIQMQGLDAQYTLILIDGVPVIGRSAGTLDLNRISVSNIAQIEIVKGPSSSLYGSEAIGGVINIITENKQSTKFSGNANYRMGTFTTQDANVNLSSGKAKFGANFSLNYFSTKGYALDDLEDAKTVMPHNNITPFLKLKYAFSDKVDMTVSGRYFYQDNDVGYESGTEKYSGNAFTNEYNGHFKIVHKANAQWNFIYELYSTQYKTIQQVSNVATGDVVDDSYYKENLLRPEVRATYIDKNTTYTAGVGYNQNNLDRTYFSDKADNNSLYAFAQYDYNVAENWNFLAGARFDKNEAYASAFSPKLALRYEFNKNTSIQGSVGYGFKVPDLRQLYFDFENTSVGYIVLGYNVAANRLAQLENQGRIESYKVAPDFFSSDLQPERSIGFNIGTNYKLSKWKSSVNIFYNKMRNLIDTKAVAQLTNGQNVFSYTNIGSVFTAGTEINSAFQVTSNFQIALGYQYLIAKDNAVVDAIERGEKYARDEETLATFKLKKSDYFGLFNRSKHMANFKTNLNIPSWKINHTFRATYRSKYGLYDTNDNAILDKYDVFAKEYVIFDTSLSKSIGKHFEVFAGADNIFNFTDSQNASNISGRIVYGKVQFNF